VADRLPAGIGASDPVPVAASLEKGELTEPEQSLCTAAAAGRVLDLRRREAAGDDPADGHRWGPARTIRAELLRQLVCGEEPSAPRPVAVRVRGARIVGPLNLGGRTLICPLELYECYLGDPVDLAKADAPAISLRGSYLHRRLSGRGLRLERTLNLSRGFRCRGPVRLRGARIGGQLDLSGATLHHPHGDAINAEGVQVELGLACRERFAADGAVRLDGAHIAGLLDLTGARFRNPDGDAINAVALRVNGGAFWHPDEVSGRLNLAFAYARVWRDNAIGRATPTVLRGFRYDALHPGPDEVRPQERIAWLNRDPGYSPQPYRQLAGSYRAVGHDASARKVLVASEDRRRRTRKRHWPHRAWGRLLWGTVRYGYQPWIALLWILALATIGTLVIMARPHAELTPGPNAPPRNALLYTVDMLLPFVDLGYSRWVAHGPVLMVTTALIGLGWVLATAVVAAFADVLRRGG
jgi:hypothetical protein